MQQPVASGLPSLQLQALAPIPLQLLPTVALNPQASTSARVNSPMLHLYSHEARQAASVAPHHASDSPLASLTSYQVKHFYCNAMIQSLSVATC